MFRLLVTQIMRPTCPKHLWIMRKKPREYFLNSVTTILDVATRVSDLYSNPYDQNQRAITFNRIEAIKERQESELITMPVMVCLPTCIRTNGFPLAQALPRQMIWTSWLAKSGKNRLFLAHPLAIAAFGRECTRRGVPPPTASLFWLTVSDLAWTTSYSVQ